MLPAAFLDIMRRQLGADLDRFLAAMDQPPKRGLHVNLAKEGAFPSEDLAPHLSPLPFAHDGYAFLSDETVGAHPLHHAGAFYMQEPSAMLPVCASSVREGMRVLDVCAAPGGKTTQLANRIGRGGLLVSNEISSSRRQILIGNIERMGLSNICVTGTDAAGLAEAFPAFFDLVLVDAPCSGEGMFRKDPAAADEWTAESPHACAVRQREILSYAARTLRPGGELIYSTCTFSVEENEQTVMDFLARHPDFVLSAVPASVEAVTSPGIPLADAPVDLSLCRRAYPHGQVGEGQFLARLVHTGTPELHTESVSYGAPLPKADAAVVDAFLKDVLSSVDGLPPATLFRGGVTLAPSALPSASFAYARGVRVGELRKGRVVPHHQFFSAYGSLFKRKIDFSLQNPHLFSYLRGETFPCDLPDGWAVVTVCGYPLGGIKVTGGIAKNHYPAGLRSR